MPAPPPKRHQWKKGQTGNPNGCSAKRRVKKAFQMLMPEVAAKAPLLTADALRVMIAGIMAGSVADVKDAEKQLGEQLCLTYRNWVTALQVAAKKGDVSSLIKAAEFVYGKAPERYELSGPNGAPIDVKRGNMSIEDMQAELAAIRKRKKAQGLD